MNAASDATVHLTPQQSRDAALIERVRAGEREAFYELIQPYERKVYGAAFAILRNQEDAEDTAQDSFLKALKNLHQFRFEARFSTWLIQITINEARMRLRRMRSGAMQPMGEFKDEDGDYTPREFPDWREIPSESLERSEVRDLLMRALASIGEKYREIFIMRDMNQLSIDEVAKALGISHASVKTRLLRARLMLRDLLAPSLAGGFFSTTPQKGEKPW